MGLLVWPLGLFVKPRRPHVRRVPGAAWEHDVPRAETVDVAMMERVLSGLRAMPDERPSHLSVRGRR